MATKTELDRLKPGDILTHVSIKNADGTPARCRVNGKMKEWKTRPHAWQLPVKHGLRNCFYITEHNASDWNIPQ